MRKVLYRVIYNEEQETKQLVVESISLKRVKDAAERILAAKEEQTQILRIERA